MYLTQVNLFRRQGESIVKASPTFKPQTVNSLRRLRDRLDNDWNRADARMEQRIRLIESRLDPARVARAAYDAVICNSLLHHLADPALLWQTAVAAARPEAPVLVVDLARPETPEAASALVDRHADGAPALMRRDFFNSLLAAYTADEVVQQLRMAGLDDFAVETVSDRHWLAWRNPRR